MTITTQTGSRVDGECALANTRWMKVRASAAATVVNILYDRGDGFRPLLPLLVKINGSAANLPAPLLAGTNTIEFLGGWLRDAVGISIRGVNLMALTSLAIGDTIDLPEVEAMTTTSGPGVPSTIGRRTGDWHYDTSGKYWYRLTEGAWQQQP
jgi:hypothetical protein